MVLNIGDGDYVNEKNIIAILDKDSIDLEEFKAKFIRKNNYVYSINIKDESDIKSYIVTLEDSITKIYGSIISSKTLLSRNDKKEWR